MKKKNVCIMKDAQNWHLINISVFFLDFIHHPTVLQQTEWSLRHLLRHILPLRFPHIRFVFRT